MGMTLIATSRPEHGSVSVVQPRAVAGALLLAASGPMTLAAGLDPRSTLLVRAGWALPVVLLVLVARRLVDGALPVPGRSQLLAATVAGAALAANLALWHVAMRHVGLGTATVASSAQVGLAALPGLSSRARRPVVLALAAGTAALLAATVLDDHPARALAMMAGAAVAGAVVLLAWERAALTDPGARDVALAWASGATALTALLAAGPALGETLAAARLASPTTHLALATVAGVAQVGAWTLLGGAVGRVGTARSGPSLLVGPVAALLVGNTVFGEPVGPLHVLAVAGILAASHRARSPG